jgi:hypothetical protein
MDEHKLCMHLCSIVEPFILSATHCDDVASTHGGNLNALFKRRVLLIHQPTEILDRITFFVENREDLMNLGLACKRLSEIVFPRHWEYRIIRAKISMVGVWKHLYERSDLAVNVRVIEVVDERSDKRLLVPRACRKAVVTRGPKANVTNPGAGIKAEEVVSATSTDEDSSSASGSDAGEAKVVVGLQKVSIHRRQEKYFVGALGRMSGLRKLKWEANHFPMSVLDDSDGAIWKTLVEKCSSLGALEVADNMAFSPLAVDEEDNDEEGCLINGSNKSAVSLILSNSVTASTYRPFTADQSPIDIVTRHLISLWCLEGTIFE